MIMRQFVARLLLLAAAAYPSSYLVQVTFYYHSRARRFLLGAKSIIRARAKQPRAPLSSRPRENRTALVTGNGTQSAS